MTPLTYLEDPGKLRTSTIRNSIICAVLAIVGLLVVFNMRKMGYLEMALGGSMLGGGGMGLYYAIKGFSRIGKPPVKLLSADDNGITICTGENMAKLIPWKDIQSIKPAQKGIMHGVSIILKQPDLYFESLSSSEKTLAKQNKQLFGSPASIKTQNCVVSKEEIANELNKSLKSFSVPT